MKSCTYCGFESDEAALHCAECGTEFASLANDSPTTAAPDARQCLDSPAGRAVSSVLGSVFVPTAIGFIAMRAFFDIQEIAHGGPIDKPGIFAVGMLGAFLILPPVAIFTVIFTFNICLSRCRTQTQGIICALTAIAVVLAPFLFRPLLHLFPAILFVKLTHPSFGWYLGSVIQLALGAWSLGWIDRLRRRYARNSA